MTDPRKATLPDRLTTVREVMWKRREELALEIVGLEVVLAAITMRATAGQHHATFEAPDGIDLRGTTAWTETVAELNRQGFSVEERVREGREAGQRCAALFVWWAE